MNDATASNIPTNITAAPSFAPVPAPAVTPGWRTSEFWMTALSHLGLVFATVSGALPAKYAVFAGALSQVAYSVSRGMAKAGASSAS